AGMPPRSTTSSKGFVVVFAQSPRHHFTADTLSSFTSAWRRTLPVTMRSGTTMSNLGGPAGGIDEGRETDAVRRAAVGMTTASMTRRITDLRLSIYLGTDAPAEAIGNPVATLASSGPRAAQERRRTVSGRRAARASGC